MLNGMMDGIGWTLFLVIALLIGLMLSVATIVVWLMLGRGRGQDAMRDPPLEALRQRLTLGENAPEEFDRLSQQADRQ
jgi:uncharacterized membrane protein